MTLFDTTKQQSIYPGINATQGVVDTSGSIDTSALSAVAELGTMALDYAITEDKKDVMNEASQRAQDLTDEYLSRSPSEQAYLLGQKEELETNITNVSNNEKEKVVSRLRDINERLARASSQGAMTAMEYERRLAAIAQDISNSNPVYAPEIAQEVNRIRGASGVNTLISADEALLKQQAKAMDDRYKMMIETVEPFIMDPYSLSPDDLELEFYRIKSTQVNANKITNFIENKELLDKMSASEAMDMFNKLGPHNIRRTTSEALFAGLRAIAKDGSRDFEQKKRDAFQLIQDSKNKVFEAAYNLPQDDKRVSFFVENMKGLYDDLEKFAEDGITLEGLNKYMGNKKAIMERGIDIKQMQGTGTYAAQLESFTNFMTAYNAAKQSGLLSQDMVNAGQNLFENFMKGVNNPGQFNHEELAVYEDPAFNTGVMSQLKDVTGEEDNPPTTLVANYLQSINNLDKDIEAHHKVLSMDKNLRHIGSLSPEAYNKVVNNDKLREAFEEQVMQYSEMVAVDIINATVNMPNFELKRDPTTGRFGPTNSPAAKRVNIYVKARAQMEGKDFKDVSEMAFQEIQQQVNKLDRGNISGNQSK